MIYVHRLSFDLRCESGIYIYKELCVGGSNQNSILYLAYKHNYSILGSYRTLYRPTVLYQVVIELSCLFAG